MWCLSCPLVGSFGAAKIAHVSILHTRMRLSVSPGAPSFSAHSPAQPVISLPRGRGMLTVYPSGVSCAPPSSQGLSIPLSGRIVCSEGGSCYFQLLIVAISRMFDLRIGRWRCFLFSSSGGSSIPFFFERLSVWLGEIGAP